MSNAQKLPVVFEAADYTATLSVVIEGTTTPFPIPGTIQVDFYRFSETAPFISSTLANGRLGSVNASGGIIVFDIPAADLAGIGPALGTVTVRRIDIPQVIFSYNARFADANEALTADFSTNVLIRMNDITVNISPSSIEVYADHVHPNATTSVAGFMSAADKTIVDGVTAGLASKIPSSEKGAANGVAPLGSDSKISATYLPSYVDDVLEYANTGAFPGTGETGKIYVAVDTGKTWRWSGSAYVEISASPGSTDAVPEGATNKYFTDARAISAVTPLLNAKLDDSQASAFGLSLLDDADAASARATLGAAATSHTHPQSDVTNLVSDLAGKAPLASPALTGTPTAPTPALADDSTRIATTEFVVDKIAAATAGVSQFNGRTGAVALIGTDVINAVANVEVVEVHRDGTGDRFAGVDLHAYGTPAANDYSARLLRFPGANGDLVLAQTGTGVISSSGGSKQVRVGDGEVTGAFDVGGMATVLQLKFKSAVGLGPSTDLNTITVGGFYDVAPDPVNAPHASFGWGYLEVQGHSNTASGYYMQRLTRLASGKGDCVWGRVCLGGTWQPWRPISGFVTPEHFGGSGSSTTGASTDNSVALQRWMSSDQPKLLDQFYKLNGVELLAWQVGKAGFQLSGRGGCSGIILEGGANISIQQLDQDNPVGFNADLCTIRDLSIFVNQDAAAIPLGIYFLDGDSGSTMPGVNLDNVHVIPASTTTGSSGAQILLYNARQSQLTNVSVAGKYFAYAGTGIEFASGAGSAPTDVVMLNVRMAHLNRGLYLPTEQGSTTYDAKQGHHLKGCVALAVNRGYEISGGSEGFGEWWVLDACHAYFREAGILMNDAGNVHITNNYLLAHGALTTAQGIALTGTSISKIMQINNNNIDMAACTATNRYGINTPATWVGRVQGNRVRNATNAFGLIGAGPSTGDNATY